MRPEPRFGPRHLLVFYISLMAISAELCLALMLSLKAFSHMVYVVISFSLLGYGLGSTLFLLLKKRLAEHSWEDLAAVALFLVSALTVVAAQLLPQVPLKLKTIYTGDAILLLGVTYGLVALPFAGIGFLITLIFSRDSSDSARLYFWDLAGAGAGAIAFFPMLSAVGPLRCLVALSALALFCACLVLGVATPRRKRAVAGFVALGLFEVGLMKLPEPVYEVDRGIGWEWIPGNFDDEEYVELWRRWHPLGRSDLHRIINPGLRRRLYRGTGGVLEICVDPRPEFSYFTNNYRAGTPVYALNPADFQRLGCKVVPFSVPMECPYVLLDRPRVLVIGAGGGRDLFMAGVHGAADILGAEINPATYAAMSPGGVAYDYSDRLYSGPRTKVLNIDGRHLVKTRPAGSEDLIILNGIDTFAALSSGAYAFAENYLYTKEAIVDYLRALSDDGILNFNRWFEGVEEPRETLRLLLMSLDALRAVGVQDPARHVIVGAEVQSGWGLMLIKRSPFNGQERAKLLDYFKKLGVTLVYDPETLKAPAARNPLDEAVAAFRDGQDSCFIRDYWADVSVVHDDNPFFYKYYKFDLQNLRARTQIHPGGGATAFIVQIVIVAQTIAFILLFIFLPLVVARRRSAPLLPGRKLSFLIYFAALGTGFIFIEITLMQRFTLALGSPIYSISVTLATLLVASGAGSLLSERFRRWAGSEARMIRRVAALVVAYLVAMIAGGTPLLNVLVPAPFAVRALLSVLLLAPIGVCLGVFFPAGLKLVGSRDPDAVPWAWGINSGFTVLGSTLSICIAQFLGFNVILSLAAACYAMAPLAFGRLSGAEPARPAA
jgi:spermidine synthase